MRSILLIAAAALSACAAYPPAEPYPQPPPPPGGISTASVTLPVGGRASVNGIGLAPLQVVEDSRCPANVNCVWAGRLVVLTEVLAPGGGEQLNLRMELGKPIAVYGGSLTLISAAPAKYSGEPVSPRSYRFTYRFER